MTTNDSGPGSFREAILSANSVGEGTILFSNVSGVIVLQSELPPITGNLRIQGPGAELLSISGTNACRLLTVNPNSTTSVARLTLGFGRGDTNFSHSPIVNAGYLSFLRCDISFNHTVNGFGGAIYNTGRLLMQLTSISDNFAERYEVLFPNSGRPSFGGAIYQQQGSTTLVGCSLSRNRTWAGNVFYPEGVVPPYSHGVGGAIFMLSGTLVARQTGFSENSAWGARAFMNFPGYEPVASYNGYGGAVTVADGDASFIECSFINNSALGPGGDRGSAKAGAAYGGGIFVGGGTVAITNCTIENNTALGGVGSMKPLDSAGNGGRANGGGVALTNGNLLLFGSTIASNRAGGETAEAYIALVLGTFEGMAVRPQAAGYLSRVALC